MGIPPPGRPEPAPYDRRALAFLAQFSVPLPRFAAIYAAATPDTVGEALMAECCLPRDPPCPGMLAAAEVLAMPLRDVCMPNAMPAADARVLLLSWRDCVCEFAQAGESRDPDEMMGRLAVGISTYAPGGASPALQGLAVAFLLRHAVPSASLIRAALQMDLPAQVAEVPAPCHPCPSAIPPLAAGTAFRERPATPPRPDVADTAQGQPEVPTEPEPHSPTPDHSTPESGAWDEEAHDAREDLGLEDSFSLKTATAAAREHARRRRLDAEVAIGVAAALRPAFDPLGVEARALGDTRGTRRG